MDGNERMSELDNILNLFAGEYLFFSALKQNQELELLYDLVMGTSKRTAIWKVLMINDQSVFRISMRQSVSI